MTDQTNQSSTLPNVTTVDEILSLANINPSWRFKLFKFMPSFLLTESANVYLCLLAFFSGIGTLIALISSNTESLPEYTSALGNIVYLWTIVLISGSLLIVLGLWGFDVTKKWFWRRVEKLGCSLFSWGGTIWGLSIILTGEDFSSILAAIFVILFALVFAARSVIIVLNEETLSLIKLSSLVSVKNKEETPRLDTNRTKGIP